jgi:uncharacterized protein YbaR (Trm112 family)
LKLAHIELLKCLECGGALTLSSDHVFLASKDSIGQGILRCRDCAECFPIIDSVAVFFRKPLLALFLNDHEKRICLDLGFAIDALPLEVTKEIILTKKGTDNWSYQWNVMSPSVASDFENNDLKGELCFRNFIRLRKEEYAGKTVVVWCGGNGREAYHIAKYKPRLLIVNEIGDEIYRIHGLMDGNMNLLLLRSDMLHNPLRNGIAEISICDHALQHDVDKKKALSMMTNVLAPGGTVAMCVYSYENKFLMTHMVEAMKSKTHRISLKGQEMIALFPAILVFLLIRSVILPANYLCPAGICRKIPLYEHFMFWSKCKFATLWTSCFDLIHAPISYYFRKGELQELAEKSGLNIETLIHTHGTTWSLVAKKE